MLKIAEFIAFDFQLAGFDHLAQRLSQNRQQYLAAQAFILRIPVDVEVGRIPALRPMPQHIHPPRVLCADGHVVRHNVDDQAEARGAQRSDKLAKRFLAAKLGIDARRIDHVIAMHRARTRSRDGRRVDMTDAQPHEIRHQPLGVREGEALVELEAGRSRAEPSALPQSLEARTHAAARSKSSADGFSKRRRQFGCSSIVPGRFGCSVRPSTSSIGMSASGAGDCAVKAIAASTAESGCEGGGSIALVTPPVRNALHRALRSCVRSFGSRASSASPSFARVAMSAPLHHPAAVGRSCVLVIATALDRHFVGGRKRLPSRWNQSTSIPAMPASAMRSRNSGWTVPRSSPITIARWRCDFERDQPQQVVERVGEIGSFRG